MILKDLPRDVEVEEDDALYLWCERQVEHNEDGRKSSLLLVSNLTVYSTGGVPIEIVPAMYQHKI
jgi:hypothetical protein